MTNIKHLHITLMSLLLLFFSCSQEDDSLRYDEGKVAVKFSSSFEAVVKPQTRASGTEWSQNDKVGIFMMENSKSLSEASIVSGASNIAYKTAGNGFFSVADAKQTIYYPGDGSLVDFVAYYPFKSDLSKDYIYKVDLKDQSNIEAIDLLYSNNITGASKKNPNAKLSFSHQLSYVRFNIEAGLGVNSLDGLKVSFSGLPTMADFDLATGKLTIDESSIMNFESNVQTDGKMAEAIVIPVGNASSVSVTFSLGSKVFKWNIPSGFKFEAGQKYTFNVTIKNTGTEVVNPRSGWTETPAYSPTNDLQYVTHMIDSKNRNFSLLYDQTNHVALWVAYPLHAYHITGSIRSDAWAYDPQINKSLQPLLNKSWPSYPTYNRGHQIASGDRTLSRSANSATFYYSNMALQATNFNSGSWNDLENKVRSWAGSGIDTLYVVTGVMISSSQKPTIAYEKDNASPALMCAIPQYFYKALAKQKNGKFYTIGYKLPNTDAAKNYKYDDYRITVADLEKETGFTFFPNIASSEKQTIDSNFWR